MVAVTPNRNLQDFRQQAAERGGKLGCLRHVGEIVPLVLAQYGDPPRPAAVRLPLAESFPLVTSEAAR